MKLSEDAFRNRERNLEDEFFFRVDQELNRKLREKMETEAGRERLADVTGISDESLVVELFDLGITSETLAAFSLVPLVCVAWADRIVDTLEREAVLKAAHQSGVADDSASYKLLEHWLHNRPPANLFDAWKGYAEALTHSLAPESLGQLRDRLVERARTVAKKTGGFLGLGSVSSTEEDVLRDIEHSLHVVLPGAE